MRCSANIHGRRTWKPHGCSPATTTSTPCDSPTIKGAHVVVEEKLDGANSAISFDSAGRLLLQSRGHFLTGGPRERQFAPLKAWAATIAAPLRDRIDDRYVIYGEWLYAKHTVFYDALPHYFCEFDVYDRVGERVPVDTGSARDCSTGCRSSPYPCWMTVRRRRWPR